MRLNGQSQTAAAFLAQTDEPHQYIQTLNVSVSALATDNENKMSATRRLYVQKHPQEGSIGCAPHAADLIAGEVLKHPIIGPTVKVSKKLQDKLKNTKLHQFLAIKLAANRSNENASSIRYVGIPMHCATRWNSFAAVANFQTKHKWVIGSLSIDTAAAPYMNDLCRAIINCGTLWTNVDQIKSILEPISTTVTALQADTSCSSVYYYWNRMQQLLEDNNVHNMNDVSNNYNNRQMMNPPSQNNINHNNSTYTNYSMSNSNTNRNINNVNHNSNNNNYNNRNKSNNGNSIRNNNTNLNTNNTSNNTNNINNINTYTSDPRVTGTIASKSNNLNTCDTNTNPMNINNIHTVS